jgi:hypothetical protein
MDHPVVHKPREIRTRGVMGSSVVCEWRKALAVGTPIPIPSGNKCGISRTATRAPWRRWPSGLAVEPLAATAPRSLDYFDPNLDHYQFFDQLLYFLHDTSTSVATTTTTPISHADIAEYMALITLLQDPADIPATVPTVVCAAIEPEEVAVTLGVDEPAN